MFPTGQLQWCTSYLKMFPFAEFADRIDPKNKAIIVLGKRRAESAQRKTTQEFETSELYDRKLWNPLYKHTNKQRNKLIIRAGFVPLPHRSMECCPCVNANKTDLQNTPEICLDRVRELEKQTKLLMYNPNKKMGAEGIDEVLRWARSSRGKYSKKQITLWESDEQPCGSGMCG